jgi:hypothetical protein
MAKNNLKDQIEQVSFWFTSGIFWYLVIAFFLKSKYPISEYAFNPATAYDVVKDALTLAAAFLAPVTALLLFSDWRDQSRYSSFMEEVDKINDIFSEIMKIGREGHSVLSVANGRITEDDYRKIESRLGTLDHMNIQLFEFEDPLLNNDFKEHNDSARTLHEIILLSNGERSALLTNLKALLGSANFQIPFFIIDISNRKSKLLEIQKSLDLLEESMREIKAVHMRLVTMN